MQELKLVMHLDWITGKQGGYYPFKLTLKHTSI
jgi:hypothetical protein